jgi:hypothetical protein
VCALHPHLIASTPGRGFVAGCSPPTQGIRGNKTFPRCPALSQLLQTQHKWFKMASVAAAAVSVRVTEMYIRLPAMSCQTRSTKVLNFNTVPETVLLLRRSPVSCDMFCTAPSCTAGTTCRSGLRGVFSRQMTNGAAAADPLMQAWIGSNINQKLQ